MKYITVFGNCQCEAVTKFLKIGLPQKDWQVAYLSNNSALGNMKSIPEIIEGFEKSDILIYQPLDERHGLLSENNIKRIVKKETDLVSFAYIFNSGMYSMDYNPHPKTSNYGVVYGEEVIIPLLKEYDFNTVIELYRNGLIDFNLKNRFQVCIAELQRRESQTDIRLSDFILDNYQKYKLMITHNHPTTKVFLEICSQIKELTHIPFSYSSIDIENENLMNLPTVKTPISPYDIKNHEYNFGYHQDWLTQGGQLIQLIAENNKSEKEKEIDIVNNLMKSDKFSETALKQHLSKNLLSSKMDDQGWPRDVKSLVKRAEDLMLKGSSIDFIYACDSLDKALYLLPNDPVLLVTRGRVLRQIGDLDNAREDFKKAINLAPDFVPLLLKTLNLDTIL